MRAVLISEATALFVLIFFSTLVSATTIHIKADASGDFPTIQAGINAAGYGDTVLLAAGTYSGEGNYSISFDGRAITVTSESGPGATIVDCQGKPVGFILVSDEEHYSVLSGLTIQNTTVYGIWCWCSSPTIKNNIITGCSGGYGGAIYVDGVDYMEPIITNNIICNNNATQGGGIYCFGESPIISHNTICDNAATYGGGIYCVGSAVISDNTICGNSATYGGGIYLGDGNSQITNSIMAFSPQGEGILCQPGNAVITNCDVFGNAAGDTLRGTDGGGNISADPMFCGVPGSGNYYLRSISPCAPGNHSSGSVVGAWPVGCGSTSTKKTTWGGLKDRFK
jgi:predicted outer membrane repeat protein